MDKCYTEYSRQAVNYRIYRFWIFFLFLYSMYPWVTLSIPPIIPNFIGSLLSFSIIQKKIYTSRLDGNRLLLFICFMFLLLWIFRRSNFFGFVNIFFIIITIFSLISLRPDYKVDIIKYLTKWFAFLLLISLIFYILNLLSVPLPSIPLDSSAYDATNYFFFIQSEISIRFQGLFIEPGHMTMGLAPLLFLNKYNFKDKYVFILMVAQLFSVSLAGYICLVAGLLLTLLFGKEKRKTLKVLLTVLLMLTVFVVVENKLLGADFLKETVIARLEWNGESIEGNNRAAAGIDYYYYKVINSDSKWTGIDASESVLLGNAGYMVMVVSNGVIGLLLMILCYVLPAFRTKSFLMGSLSFSLILEMLLFQNAYPDWWCMIIFSICGMIYYQKTNEESSIYCTQRKYSRSGSCAN